VRLRPALTRLLVVLLLLQWGTAFAHCLRLAAPGDLLHLEICSAEGIRTVAISSREDGEAPAPQAQPSPFCPACLGPGALTMPPPEATVAPPLLLAQATDPPRTPPANPPPLPPRSCQPRAPPPTS
jgi:hypothetical protein